MTGLSTPTLVEVRLTDIQKRKAERELCGRAGCDCEGLGFRSEPGKKWLVWGELD